MFDIPFEIIYSDFLLHHRIDLEDELGKLPYRKFIIFLGALPENSNTKRYVAKLIEDNGITQTSATNEKENDEKVGKMIKSFFKS